MTQRRPSAPSRFALRFIATYRQEVSGRQGHTCGSVPSCSEYGDNAYRTHGFVKATTLTIRHLVRCRPAVATTTER